MIFEFTFYSSSIKGRQLIELRHYLLHLHSTLVLLKGTSDNCHPTPLLYLHSTLVLLKGFLTGYLVSVVKDLHSTLVLLKVVFAPLLGLFITDLHSTLVLLKVVSTIRNSAGRQWFTFYSSSIKGSYHLDSHSFHLYLHSTLVLLKVRPKKITSKTYKIYILL